MRLISWTLWSGSEQFIYNWKTGKKNTDLGRKLEAAGLELAESFILCGHQAFKTHIKNIAVFIHKDNRMEVAQGHFNDK